MNPLLRVARRVRNALYGWDALGAEERWRELIARHAPGRSFADVGCMWKVDGAYAFLAADRGATAVTGIDVMAATPGFAAANRARADAVRFRQGDVNDPALVDWAGVSDVVFCSGVLYHVPNPVFTLEQLRRICRETLILATASLAGARLPNAAVFVPGLDARRRAGLTYRTRWAKVGLDSPFRPEDGYANWVWLPSPDCVLAMLDVAGFTVRECYRGAHVTTVVATPRAPVAWTSLPPAAATR